MDLRLMIHMGLPFPEYLQNEVVAIKNHLPSREANLQITDMIAFVMFEGWDMDGHQDDGRLCQKSMLSHLQTVMCVQ